MIIFIDYFLCGQKITSHYYKLDNAGGAREMGVTYMITCTKQTYVK
jgi:hypothetical protein